MINALQTILDVLWLILKIGVLIFVILFLYGLVRSTIDYIQERRKNG